MHFLCLPYTKPLAALLRIGGFGVVFLVTVMVLFPPTAHADVNDFVITDFDANYSLTRGDPQGSLAAQERLKVKFSDQNHGILRALPQRYLGQNQHLKLAGVSRDGTAEKYSTYTSNGNLVLKIGDPDRTITGAHTYDITYTAQNVIRFSSGSDQLIWNTNGTQWQQPFEQQTATLKLAPELAPRLMSTQCFTGSQGSTARDCTVERDGTTVVFRTTRSLQPGETMTFQADFPVGTFAKPTLKDWWQDHGHQVLQIVVPPLLAFVFAYRYWFRRGKDLRGRGTIVPEYSPPGGLGAAEADVINNYKLGNKAISATVIDLAIRRHLRIIETESKGTLGLGKKKSYTFERLTTPTHDVLKPHESSILGGLFPKGDKTNTDDLKGSFYKVAQAAQTSLPESLTDAGYFPANPGKVGVKLLVVAIVLFVGSWFIVGFDWPLTVGLIAAAGVLFVFSALMPRRTSKGVQAKEALSGLKLYMKTAEKDRMAMLQSADAPYAPKSSEPKRTVELFEKLLPFAIVMGVENSWAQQFKDIYTTPPDWYHGNWTAFNTGYLVGSLNNSVSAMNTSFAAPSSSGSGSGGSFSGGGGGGGGGGGW